MLHNVINHYILTCGSICGAVQLVYNFFAVQCGMRTELSGAVQFADKNFAHRTISTLNADFLEKLEMVVIAFYHITADVLMLLS